MLKIYKGDCDSCKTKNIEVVSFFRSAYIPNVASVDPLEYYDICESCLSAAIEFVNNEF